MVKGVDERDEVADDVEDGIRPDVVGGFGVAVAAEIGGDGAVDTGGEGEDLVAPRVPQLGEAVMRRTTGPSPFSATYMFMPLTATVR